MPGTEDSPCPNVLPSQSSLLQKAGITEEQYSVVTTDYKKRLESLFETQPLNYREQNGGDYDENLELIVEPDLQTGGTAIHIKKENI